MVTYWEVTCKKSVVFCVSCPFVKIKMEKEHQALFLGRRGNPT